MTTTPTVWKAAVRENDSVLLAQTHSRVTGLTNGNYLVSWTDNNQIPGPGLETDILGALYDPEGNLLRNDFLLNQNYQVDDEGKQSIGAMSGGKFVVVFEDQNASGVSIRAQGLDENGDDLFIKTILADPGAPVLSNISVAVRSDDSFVVTYQQTDGTDHSVRAIEVSNTQIVGTPTIIRADTTPSSNGSDPRNPHSATLTNGSVAIVYQENDGSDSDIEFRLFHANGSLGSQIAVNADVIEDSDPRVAALAGGGFVITWESDGVIVGEIYDGTGAVVTNQFTIHAGPDSNSASVVGLADGSFFVAWDDDATQSLTGQRFDATGAAIGSAQQIASGADTGTPDLSLTADGRILVGFTDPEINSLILDPRDTTFTIPGTALSNYPTTTRIDDGTVIGSNAADTILGQGGADTLSGGGGNDTIYGGNNYDIIDGGPGFDNLFGGAHNDLFIQQWGDWYDNVDGGSGTDTLDYTRAAYGGGTINLMTGVVSFAPGVFIQNVEIFLDNDSANTLIGSNNADTLEGNGGDDTLTGNGGHDFLRGGPGADIINGGDGDDIIQDYNVADIFDTIDGGDGFDTLDHRGLATSALLTIEYDLSTNTFTAYDYLTPLGTGSAIDIEQHVLSSNNNRILGSTTEARVFTGIGRDEYIQHASAGPSGVDLGHGMDRVEIHNAAFNGDSYRGGSDDDTVDFSNTFIPGSNAVFDLEIGLLSSSAGSESYRSFEIVVGSLSNDTILGTPYANELDGFIGDDVLMGRAGDDVLKGGQGNDVLDGGDGFDIADFSDATDNITVNFNSSSVSSTTVGTDQIANIEGATGGSGNDRFFGLDTQNEIFRGGGGSNVYSTFGGDDTVIGGDGVDRAFMGTGNDLAFGHGGADALSGQEGNDVLRGDDGNDRLYGSSGNDDLGGDDGDDLLVGGTGADLMYGGNGNDRIYVDAEDNPLGILAGPGTDRLIGQGTIGFTFDIFDRGFESAFGTPGDDNFQGNGLTLRSVMVGHGGDDTLSTGSGDDLLEGRNGNDTLFGNDGNDYLAGQNGADQLNGGADNDTLFGGNDDDILIGGTGDDLLQGDAGSDILQGGDGDDDIRIDSADFVGNVQGGNGIDTVRLQGADAFDFNLGTQGFERGFGNSAANALDGSSSAQAVIIYGLDGNDVLTGSAFADTLIAGNGDDMVAVGAGADSANGGAGSDTAIFSGLQADYNVNVVNPGVSAKITHIASGDVNSLSAFEFAQFDDGTFAI